MLLRRSRKVATTRYCVLADNSARVCSKVLRYSRVQPPFSLRSFVDSDERTGLAMADVLSKKRRLSKRHADKVRGKSRVNLGLAFTRWRALKDRLQMRSDADLGMFLLDSKLPTVLTILAEKKRAKTRVNIASAFHRWCELMEIQRLKTHSEMATFLLDWYDLTGPSTSKPSLTSGSHSPDRVQYQPRSSDEETLSASESLEERCSRKELIGTGDSHIQGKVQQAVTSGDTNDKDPESSDAAITEIIGFSDEENISPDEEKYFPDEEKYFPDEEKYSYDEGGGEGTCCNDLAGPSTSKPFLTSGSLSPDREHHQPRSSDEETLSASESLEERFSRMDSIATMDSHIQGKPQQAVTSGDTHDPESSDAAITEIIGFSDEENVSSDEENDSPDEGIDSSDEGGGEGPSDHSSDSDWTPDKTEAVPLGDTHSLSSVPHNSAVTLTENIGILNDESDSFDWKLINTDSKPMDGDPNSGENFAEAGAVGRKLRRLCPECGMLFKDLKPHTCEHKIKPCSCNVCGKRFATASHLKSHNRIHKEGWEYVCRFCLETFKTKADKIKHEWSHPPAVKPYHCSDCPETFMTFSECREHRKSHRGPVIIVCQICNMRFANKARLERHSVVHTGEKQFVCEVCQRSFNQAGHLKSHMRVHTGEKPFQCQHCDKGFNHNVSLKSHIQRYHGPGPGMKVQTKKTNKIESTAELDDTTDMENSGLDVEEAERNNDTGNSEEEEEEKGVTKKWNNTITGQGNSVSSAVITSDDQLKRKLCDGDENEEGQGNSYSASDSADEEEEKRGSKKPRKTTWKSSGRPTNSGGEEHSSDSDFDLESEEHSSDSDFDPTNGKPKKRGGAQTCKDRERRRGRSKNNPLV